MNNKKHEFPRINQKFFTKHIGRRYAPQNYIYN